MKTTCNLRHELSDTEATMLREQMAAARNEAKDLATKRNFAQLDKDMWKLTKRVE